MTIVDKINQSGKSKKSASVTFYLNQIIVQTYDFATTGIGLGSTKLTKLNIDSPPSVLGQTLRKHLSLTEYDVKHPTDFKEHWNAIKKAAGFKTNKETYMDARSLSCGQTETEITITPCENQHNTGYLHVPNTKNILSVTISDHELGLQLLKTRDMATG